MAHAAPQDPGSPVGVSYVMPVLNEEGYVRDSVAAITTQDYPGPMEVILALGASTDATDAIVAEMAAADPRLRTVRNAGGSIPSGLNAAIAEARFPVVVRVDAHSDLAPGYTTAGVADLFDKGVDVVGGVMDAQGRTSVQRAIAWAYRSRFGIGGPAYHVGGEEGPAESAYLGIYRKEWLERVGGYDEGVGRGEDWDLCQRIIAAGGRVWFNPALRVTYWPRSSVEHLARQFYSTGVWRGEITRRNPRIASPRYFVPPLTVAGIAAGTVLGMAGRRWGWLAPVGYGTFVAGLAASARDLDPRSRASLLAVIPTMHLCWGAGFLKGAAVGAAGTQDTSRAKG